MTKWKQRIYVASFSAVFLAALSLTVRPNFLQAQQQTDNRQESVTGFNGVNWGDPYAQTLERMKAVTSSGERPQFQIINATKDKEIVVREGDIVYRYVFYLNPSLKKPIPHDLKTDMEGNQTEEPQGKFFFAEINFSPVLAESIYQVLQKRYGDRSLSTAGQPENPINGAYIWQQTEGYIAQWIMQYEKAPYTRTVYYLSRAISTEIEKDFQSYMFQKELKILQDLKP